MNSAPYASASCRPHASTRSASTARTSCSSVIGSSCKAGAATRMIDRLERAGRVRRVPDPADRRRVLVERVASPAARDEVDDLVGPARESVGAVFAEFSTAEQAVLFDFFARAAPAFRKATDEIRRESSAGRRRS
nr:MarR family transcriptional regulator [Pseudonocardia endophytica]